MTLFQTEFYKKLTGGKRAVRHQSATDQIMIGASMSMLTHIALFVSYSSGSIFVLIDV